MSAPESRLLDFPLVSIIIPNYNYEDYLYQTIHSSFEQEYPNIEVIVVDDVSTDNSIEVARRAIDRRPNGRIVKRLVNAGQGPALLDGFKVSSGEFVVFLDADDILFPTFAATHVYAHLALPYQVAFTSSHLVHLGPSGRLVAAASGCICKTLLSAPPERVVGLRPLGIAPHIDDFFNKFSGSIGRCLYLSPELVGYFWSSCSGIMFKRAAIEQIVFADLIRTVQISADFYFTLAHYFNGSAIIDVKLGGYRIHGKNLYSGTVHLDGIDPSLRTDDLFLKILHGFIHYVTGPRLEDASRLLRQNYPRFLRALQEYADQQGGNHRLVAQSILQNYEQFSRLLGQDNAMKILESLGIENEAVRANLASQPKLVSSK